MSQAHRQPFFQLHDVRRAEEMSSDDVLRPTSGRRDLIYILIRRIGRKDRTFFADSVELRKDLLLESRIFVHRLDHHVDFAKRGVVRRPAYQRPAFCSLFFAELAALHTARIVSFDDRQSALQRVIAYLNHGYRYASVSKAHRNALTHRASANDANAIDDADRRVFSQPFDLRCLTLGKEEMP